MSLSPDAMSRKVGISQPDGRQARSVFPLILVCIALALILISAVFSPVTLETAGSESFLVGP